MPITSRLRLLPNNAGSLAAKSHRFLPSTPDNVIATALKMVNRASLTDGKPTEVSVDVSSLGTKSAVRTDLLERNQEELIITKGNVSATVPARSFVKMRLRSDV